MLYELLRPLIFFEADDASAGAEDDPGPATPAKSGGKDEAPAGISRVDMPVSEFNSRLSRERAAGQRDLFRMLGFEDVGSPERLEAAKESLRSLLEYAKEKRREEMDAEERWKHDLEEANKAAASMKEQAEAALAAAQKARADLMRFALMTAVLEEARDALRPRDVYVLLREEYADALDGAIGDPDSFFSEDGSVNPKAIDREKVAALVKEFRKERPELFRNSARALGSPSNANARAALSPEDERRMQAALAAARKSI